MFTKCFIGEDTDMGNDSFRDIIITFSENEMVPRVMVFWNDSVKACVNGSELIQALTKLEKAGVKILVAGHALNNLKLKSSLRVGNLANHFDLVAAINKVQKVVTF